MAQFYVAHRLFAAHDRVLGASLARRLANDVGSDNVFLPFCDTDEEDLVADVKGRRLYDLDRQRLANLSGLLAVLHGPSLDDGVCMEIGYAAALGVPVVVLSTDFIIHGLSEHGPHLLFPDPLIQVVATDTVRLDKLGPRPATASDRFRAFSRRNTHQIAQAADTAIQRLLDMAQTPHTPPQPTPATQPVAFCEPSPYWADQSWDSTVSHLDSMGYQVRTAGRLAASDPVAGANVDWATLLSAELLLADVSGPETPPGAALMIGACAARDRPVFGHARTPSWTFAHGREPNWRNLMIQYAVHPRFSNIPAPRRRHS